jgi:hypothetical protein
MKVSDIIANVKEGQLAQIEAGMKAVLVLERDSEHAHMAKYKKLYFYNDKDEIIEEIDLDADIEMLVKILAKKVDVEELIRQQLQDQGAMQVHKIAETLKKHPEVEKQITPRRGCLYLQIPNPEPGEEDHKLYLRDL